MGWKNKLKDSIVKIVVGMPMAFILAYYTGQCLRQGREDYLLFHKYDYLRETEPLPCISPVSCYKEYDGVHFEVCYENGARIKFTDFRDDGSLDVVIDPTGRAWQAEPKYNFDTGRWDYAEPVFPEEYVHMFEELHDSVKEENMPDNFYRSCDCPPYHCPY